MARYVFSDEKFTNPYAFIALEDKCNRKIDIKNIREDKNFYNLTGWLECSLEVKTPVFVPNTSNDNYFNIKNEKAKSFDFYSYEDLEGKNFDSNSEKPIPVIPGSEIRGVIRNVYETLTNSCLSAIDNDEILYKRTTTPGKPGRLKKVGNNWEITPCDRYKISSKISNELEKEISLLKENQEIWFMYKRRIKIEDELRINKINFSINNYKIEIQKTNKLEENLKKIFKKIMIISVNKKEKKEYKQGYFHKEEKFINNKSIASIFVENNNSKKEIVTKKDVENFQKTILLYRNSKVNQKFKNNEHTGYALVDLSNLEFQIYYTKRNEKYYISPAAIGREVFYNKVSNIIDSYNPCSESKNICQACSLFGMVQQDNIIASRIRFTDATVSGNYEIEDYCKILDELASPKPSAAEFYLDQQDDSHLWNYDYKWKWTGNDFSKKNKYMAKINGRKFYWHHKNVELKNKDRNLIFERNVAIRSLKKGIFKFKVFFTNISMDELNKLVKTIELEEKCCHKIGMGKPLGLGSVKMKVLNIQNRIIENLNYKFDTIDIDSSIIDYNFLGCSDKTYTNLMYITNIDNAPDNIAYPHNFVSNNETSKNFEWFVANKQIDIRDGGKGGKGTKPIIEQILPKLNKNDNSLKKYKQK